MQHYSIQPSLDTKIMGHYPQVKEVIYHCHIWDEPRFIGRFHFERIDIEPIVANPILHPKAHLTDLLSISSVGFTFYLLISGKVKSILENQENNCIQFIQCSVFQNGIEFDDYWLLNIYEINNEFIDFSKSKISVDEKKEEGGRVKRQVLGIRSKHEFDELVKKHKEKLEVVSVDNIIIKEDVNANLFLLHGLNFTVSEKLKQKLELADCTGFEFRPSEISFNEFLAPDGERTKLYGKV